MENKSVSEALFMEVISYSYGIEDLDVESDLVKKLCFFLPLASLVNLSSSSARLGSAMEGTLSDRLEVECERVLNEMQSSSWHQFDFDVLELSDCEECEEEDVENFDSDIGSYFIVCHKHEIGPGQFKEEF